MKIINAGIGGINESDVVLANASNAIIMGFNVRADKAAKGMNSLSSYEDFSRLKISELKERLKAKGKPVSGKKAELIQRLKEA